MPEFDAEWQRRELFEEKRQCKLGWGAAVLDEPTRDACIIMMLALCFAFYIIARFIFP